MKLSSLKNPTRIGKNVKRGGYAESNDVSDGSLPTWSVDTKTDQQLWLVHCRLAPTIDSHIPTVEVFFNVTS
jgi:hypothetical protein